MKDLKETEVEVIEEDEDLNASSYLAKFENLAKSFEVTTKEMEESVKKKVKEVKEKAEDSLSTQEAIMTLNTLSEDFQVMRQTLLENMRSASLVLNQLNNEIIMDGVDVKPQVLTAYAEFTNAVNSSSKILSSLYKDFTTVYVKMKQLDRDNESDKNTTINNNTLIIASTAELLERIKG